MPSLPFAGRAVFVIDGGRARALGFDEIEFGDDAEALAGKRDGARVDLLVLLPAVGSSVARASTRLCWAEPSSVSALSRKTPSTHS